MKLTDVGEFGLIDRLSGILPPPPEDVLVSIGDDAAVWRWGSKWAVATTDTMVENVHFRRHFGTWYDLGWKSMAVNLSDIAATGAIADYALVTIGLPTDVEVESVGEIYHGMADISRQFATAIVGGDTVSSPLGIIVSVTVLGQAQDANEEALPRLLRRSGARPGDRVCVTGHLGSSAAGLETLLRGIDTPPTVVDPLRQAHLRPVPRMKEGQTLAALGVQAGMDISDGLAGDLQKICQQSGVGARIWVDSLPIHSATREVFPTRCTDFALYGGEDYELLFCAPEAIIEAVRTSFTAKGLAQISVIGEIIADPVGEVLLITPDGLETRAGSQSYDHFAGKQSK